MFNKQERSGIFYLLLLLIAIQTGYFFYSRLKVDVVSPLSLNTDVQQKIDSLRLSQSKKDSVKLYPFNPNFITDFKGYTLGMSIEEIDRLHRFRAQNKFVNTVEEFQEVTLVPDSLLDAISHQFKFPEWARKAGKESVGNNRLSGENNVVPGAERILQDLNSVTAEELKRINGIGETLAARIIKFRDRLGGFLVDRQLYDVYGLEPEVVLRVLERYKVINVPEISRIDLNSASVQEISKLVYIQRSVAQNIVDYRNLNGGINTLDELSKIENFPTDKIDNIALYLSLKK